MHRKYLAIIAILLFSFVGDALALTKYQDVVQDRAGNAVSGALVDVYLAGTTTSATLYTSASGAVATSNPATTDSNGSFSFFVADGLYDFTITKTGMTTQTKSSVVIVGNKPYIDISDYPSLTLAEAAAYAAGKTLYCASSYTIGSAVTISASFRAEKGCTLTKSGSGTIAFSGPFDAGLYQVFSGFGVGDVTFGSGSIENYVFSEWWGAKPDNSTDSGVAIQTALASIRTSFGNVKLNAGTYKKSVAITLYQKTHLIGSGRYVTIVENTVANVNGFEIESNSGYYRGSSIQSMTINHLTGDTTNVAINFGAYGHAHGYWSDLLIQGFGYAIKGSDEVWENTFDRIRSTSAKVCAFYFLGTDGSTSDNIWNKVYSDNPGAGGATGQGWYFETAMYKTTMLNCTVGNTSSTDTQAEFVNCLGLTIVGGNVEGFTPADTEAALLFRGTSLADVRGLVFTLMNGPSSGSASLIKVQNQATVTVDGCVQLSAYTGTLYALQITGGSTAKLYHRGNRWLSPHDVTGSLSPYQIVSTEGKLFAKVGPIDLSGAAVTHMLTDIAYGYGQVQSLKFVFSEASSSDAGIAIEVGYAGDRDAIISAVTSTGAAQWSSQTVSLTNSQSRIGTWPLPVTVYSPGGKTGTGEIYVVMEYTVSN